MRHKFFCNLVIIVFLCLFNYLLSKGVQIFPVGELDNDDFNSLNSFMNIDRIAKDLMKELREQSKKVDEQLESSIMPVGRSKPKKISKKGSVHIEEKRNKDGMQRKVVKDLGNGVKSVEITQVYNKKPGKLGMQVEDILDPFGMPNIDFPGMQMGVPTIIIKKNLKKNRDSPKINPINLLTELDNIFESFFDNLAESIIQENEANIKNKINKNGIKEDDHIDLDEIDLSLNDTEMHNNPNHKHNEHEGHIKLNYVKDVEKNKDTDLQDNELKIEDKKAIGEKDKTSEKKNKQNHELALESESTKDSNNNSDTRAAIKEKIAKKRQEQKNNKKTKNPTFVRITKFIFYLICLISLYIVVRKLLEKYGFIININETNNNVSISTKTSVNNTDELPLKQFEITEIKHQANKAD